MAAFAVEDALLKLVLAQMPVAQVLVLFGLGGALGFGGLAWARGERVLTSAALSPPMVIRSGCEIAGRLFHVLALTLVPLSQVTAILQAGPVLVVAGSALLFGEHIGPMRRAAIALCLIGVAMVLRPEVSGYSAAALLAVLGMLGTVGRDLAARALPHSLPGATIGVFGFAATIFAGLLFAVWEQRPPVFPDTPALLALVAATGVGILAYTGLTQATRRGSAALVAPFRYSRLLFGLMLGVFAFGEQVDTLSLFGCALILLSGITVLRRPG